MKTNPIITVVLPYGPGSAEIEGTVELDFEDVLDIVQQLSEEDKERLAQFILKEVKKHGVQI